MKLTFADRKQLCANSNGGVDAGDKMMTTTMMMVMVMVMMVMMLLMLMVLMMLMKMMLHSVKSMIYLQ